MSAETPQSVHVPYTVMHGLTPVPTAATFTLERRLPCVVMVGVQPAQVREATGIARSALATVGVGFPRQRLRVELNLPEYAMLTTEQLAYVIVVGVLALAQGFGTVYPCCEEINLSGKITIGRNAAALRALGASPFEGDLAELIELRKAGAALDSRSLTRQKYPKLAAAVRVAQDAHRPLLLIKPAPTAESLRAGDIPPSLGAVAGLIRGEPCAGKVAFALAGLPAPRTLPIRAPHHTVSAAGLFGVGKPYFRPGEVHLADGGVLAIDATPCWTKQRLQELAEVHASRQVAVRMGEGHVDRSTTNFLLVISMDEYDEGPLDADEITRLRSIFPNLLVYTGEEA